MAEGSGHRVEEMFFSDTVDAYVACPRRTA
jgi:hypothetical protein